MEVASWPSVVGRFRTKSLGARVSGTGAFGKCDKVKLGKVCAIGTSAQTLPGGP
jgi:hypothetical protein